MTRKPNLRRLVDSWSAKAFGALAALELASRSLPEFAQYLPPNYAGYIAIGALVLRVFIPSKSR